MPRLFELEFELSEVRLFGELQGQTADEDNEEGENEEDSADCVIGIVRVGELEVDSG